MIYGLTGSQIILNYITDDVVVFRHPEDQLNVRVVLYSLLRARFSREGYLKSYLELVDPTTVVTNEDNDLLFYRIAVILPHIMTLAVQNGRRDNFATAGNLGFFELLANQSRTIGSKVSALALFGPAVSPLYDHGLADTGQTQYVYVGSLRNNAVPETQPAIAPRLIYISSLPAMTSGADPVSDRLAGSYYGNTFTFKQYWAIEAWLVQVAARFADSNGLHFTVLGKRSSTRTGEHDFFTRVLGGTSWTFLPADTQGSSYSNAHPSDILVASESSLAYEFLGRGYRVAFIAARLALAGLPSLPDCRFGFPLSLPDRGPFWTNEADEAEAVRVMSFVMNAPDDVWHSETHLLRESLVVYDPKNPRLCQLLSSFGIQTSGPQWWNPASIPTN